MAPKQPPGSPLLVLERQVELMEVKTLQDQGNVTRVAKIEIEGCDDDPTLWIDDDEKLAILQAALVNGNRIDCVITVYPLDDEEEGQE